MINSYCLNHLLSEYSSKQTKMKYLVPIFWRETETNRNWIYNCLSPRSHPLSLENTFANLGIISFISKQDSIRKLGILFKSALFLWWSIPFNIHTHTPSAGYVFLVHYNTLESIYTIIIKKRIKLRQNFIIILRKIWMPINSFDLYPRWPNLPLRPCYTSLCVTQLPTTET